MQHDTITNPKHYQFDFPCLEVRDVINDRNHKFLEKEGYNPDLIYNNNNAIKYILRWFLKNGVEDLRKARECIDEMIEALEGEECMN